MAVMLITSLICISDPPTIGFLVVLPIAKDTALVRSSGAGDNKPGKGFFLFMLIIHKAESARFLQRELMVKGVSSQAVARCGTRVDDGLLSEDDVIKLCYGSVTVFDPIRLSAGSGVIESAVSTFCQMARERRFENPWPLIVWDISGDAPHRLPKVEKRIQTGIRPVMSRVAKLTTDKEPLGETANGFFVVIADGNYACAGEMCRFSGKRRMRDDPKAPSRSYLKVEEAYGLIGREPREGETVADLGAAPGGWSYSAAKRGALVTAVDNGPLKGAVGSMRNVRHLKEDAFVFKPHKNQTYDWLFCDIVDTSSRSLALVEKWAASHWCNAFIVNLKIGRTDPIPIIESLKDDTHPLRGKCSQFVCTELYHDREEVTIAGILD